MKGSRNLVPGVLIAVALVAVIGFASTQGLIPVLGLVANLPSCTSVPLSLSQTSFFSNDASINGPGWLVGFIVNCGGTYLVGDLASTGQEAEHDLQVTTSLNSERLIFEPDGVKDQSVFYYKWARIGAVVDINSALNDCKNAHPQGFNHFVFNKGLNGICVWHDGTSSSNFFNIQSIGSTPKIESSTTISYTAVGIFGGDSVTISEKQTSFKPSIGGNVVAQFAGYSLSGGTSLPSMANTYLVDQNKLVKSFNPQDAYNSFNTCSSNLPSFASFDQMESCLFAYNDVRTFEKGNTATALYGGSISPSVQGGNVIYDVTSKLYAFPIIVSKIKAAFLGISVPVADIQFGSVSIQPSKIASGQLGSINVEIKNSGVVAGAVTVSASCPSAETGSANTQNINAGSTKTFTVSLRAFNDGQTDASRSCSITAQSGSKTITRNLVYTAGPVVSCTSDTCSSDGKTLLICENGVYVSSVQCEIQCNPETNMCIGGVICPDGTKVISPDQCPDTNPMGGSLFFAALAGLLSFLLAGRNSFKSRDYFGLGIAAVIGVVAAYVVWYIIENIVAISVGLGIAAIFGGLAIWFLGPTILAVLLVVSTIIGNLRK